MILNDLEDARALESLQRLGGGMLGSGLGKLQRIPHIASHDFRELAQGIKAASDPSH